MRLFLIKKKNTLKDALRIITKNGNKCAVVVDDRNKLLGTLSDGDIRKVILKGVDINSTIENYYNKDPYFILSNKNENNRFIEKIFLKKKIDIIPEVNENKILQKIITWKNFFGTFKNSQKSNIPVIIMAGGIGKRLKPFTNVLPKPLIPINNKTVIEHIIDKFSLRGYQNFYITLNYKSQIIFSYLKYIKKNKKIHFHFEKKPRGTIGCISEIKLKKCKNFFVTNCDVILNFDYQDMLKFHIKQKNDITLAASMREFVVPYGICKLNNDGLLEKIEEKPKYDFLVNSGLYLFNYRIRKLIPKNKFFDLTDLLKNLIENSFRVGVYPINEDQWTDVGQWDEFKKALKNI